MQDLQMLQDTARRRSFTSVAARSLLSDDKNKNIPPKKWPTKRVNSRSLINFYFAFCKIVVKSEAGILAVVIKKRHHVKRLIFFFMRIWGQKKRSSKNVCTEIFTFFSKYYCTVIIISCVVLVMVIGLSGVQFRE